MVPVWSGPCGDMQPDLVFYGMGGVELAAAGVELLCDARKLAVVGVVEVLSHLPDIACRSTGPEKEDEKGSTPTADPD